MSLQVLPAEALRLGYLEKRQALEAKGIANLTDQEFLDLAILRCPDYLNPDLQKHTDCHGMFGNHR